MARILVIDDELHICEEFREILQEDRHVVDIALSGEEAIRKVEGADYDLVFLDVLMPRMEGRQVLEEIRKRKPVRVALVSGYMPPHKEKEAAELGLEACLSKPLDLDRVRKLIVSVVAKKSMT